jgi:hypothetical protein
MQIINPYRFEEESATSFDGFGNRSRSFDGVSDYVSIADNADIPTGAQTWACWVKIDVIEVAIIFSHWKSENNQRSFQIYLDGSGKINATANATGQSSANRTATSTSTLSTGTWYHLATIFSPSTSLKVFINGVEAGQLTSNIPASVLDSTADIGIGAYADSSLHLKGNLADCRIYDTDLTSTDISDLYNGTNVTTNLVGHWLTDADNVLDAAGTNHGTNYGSKYSYDNPSPPVEFGSASRSFNGTSNYVTVQDGSWIPTGAQTWACWIKPDADSIVTFFNHNVGTGNQRSVNLITYTGGVIYAQISPDGVTTISATSPSSTYVAGEWIHVAFTFAPSSSTGLKLYINGSLETVSNVSSMASVFNSTADIGIGANGLGQAPFQGSICDCRIYDTDLTASQISDLYSGTDVQTNLVGHWLTDNDDVEDKAGTNDGTNYGSTYSYDNPPMDLVPSRQASRSFNGTDDCILVSPDTAIDNLFSGGATFAAWIKTNDASLTNRIIDKRTNSGGSSGWILYVDDESGGNCDLAFWQGFSGNEYLAQTTSREITLGSWVHVAVVYDSSSTTNNATMYVDGSSVGLTEVTSPSGSSSNDSSKKLSIGDIDPDFTAARRAFDGNIADVRIYDTELTASQILDIYNGTTDRTNLIGQWLTNSDDVLDHAGTNDGTNNGSTYSADSPS